MSAVDRSRSPEPGDAPVFRLPVIHTLSCEHGLTAYAAEARNLAFLTLFVAVRAGHSGCPAAQCGRASLLADVLSEGTNKLDGTELQDELDSLGATLGINADDDEIVIGLSVLARHAERGANLLADLMHRPRLDEGDVERAKRQRIARLEARAADPSALAGDAWRALIFGDDHPAGRPPAGTPESINDQTRAGLASAWSDALAAGGTRVAAVGPFDASGFEALVAPIASELVPGEAPTPTTDKTAALGSRKRITLVDRPGAPQTHIRVGHLGVAASHADYYPLHALNHPLGGCFSSRLNSNLREDKGWTYGVHSGFSGGLLPGWFQVGAAVETGVTAPAVGEILSELEGFRGGGVRPEELEFARKSLSQTLLRQYESAGAKAALATNVGKYGWSPNYPAERLRWLESMTVPILDELAQEHIHTDQIEILCVGDAAAIAPGLRALGVGEVEMKDPSCAAQDPRSRTAGTTFTFLA